MTDKSIKILRLTRSRALLRYLPGLFLIPVIITLGLVLSTGKADVQILRLDSKPFTVSSHSSANTIQEHYVISENDDPAFDHSKKILEHSFTVIPELLITLLVSPYVESIFDAIDSSPYIKSFASIPLRSPPLFS
jgi:hypothetical protein